MNPEHETQSDTGQAVILKSLPHDAVPLKEKKEKKKKDKESRWRNWFITWNNPHETADTEFQSYLCLRKAKYVFQEEVGASGTRHFQGAIQFKNPSTFSQLTKVWPEIHWEVTRDAKAAERYCQKAETATGRIWHSKDLAIKKRIPRPKLEDFVDTKPRRWQECILKCLAEPPDDRTIQWFVDKDGKAGKSSFVYHLVKNYKAIKVNGKATDIKHALATYIEKMDDQPDLILVDVPRIQGNRISYGVLEELKDKCFFSGKFDSTMITLDHNIYIFVFANVPPADLSYYTADRWEIIEITKDDL